MGGAGVVGATDEGTGVGTDPPEVVPPPQPAATNARPMTQAAAAVMREGLMMAESTPLRGW